MKQNSNSSENSEDFDSPNQIKERNTFRREVGLEWNKSIITLYPNLSSDFIKWLTNLGYAGLQGFVDNELLTDQKLKKPSILVVDTINDIISKRLTLDPSLKDQVEDDQKKSTLRLKMLFKAIESFFIICYKRSLLSKNDLKEIRKLIYLPKSFKKAEWYTKAVDDIFEDMRDLIDRIAGTSRNQFNELSYDDLSGYATKLVEYEIIEANENFADIFMSYPLNKEQIVVKKRKKLQFIYFLSLITDRVSISLKSETLSILSSSFKKDRVSKINEYIKDLETKKKMSQLPSKKVYQNIKSIFN